MDGREELGMVQRQRVALAVEQGMTRFVRLPYARAGMQQSREGENAVGMFFIEVEPRAQNGDGVPVATRRAVGIVPLTLQRTHARGRPAPSPLVARERLADGEHAAAVADVLGDALHAVVRHGD